MKISNLPKATKPKNSDLITIVQGNATKVISVKDFTASLTKGASKLSSELSSLRADVFKRSLNKENPTLAKNLKIPSPKSPNDAATKNYVDISAAHRVKTDGSSKIAAPLSYAGKFSFSAKDLVTKEYADKLLDATMKTVKVLHSDSYPKASPGDIFVLKKEIQQFAGGPEIQAGDMLICIEESSGGTHGAAGSQFAILNTNVVTATEQNSGILKIATDTEVEKYSSDTSALTPKKLKDSLLSNSFFNRTSINVSSYTVVESDRGILAVDNRRNSCTITLPSITSLKDPEMFKLVVKDEFGQADIRNITVKAAGSSIDGDTAKHLTNKYQAITIYNDGKNYYIENNTHAITSLSEKVLQAGIVYPSVTGSAETLYQASVDLSDFDLGQGFIVEVSGYFAANTNTKTLAIEIDGTVTVTNTTTTAPNADWFVARVTVMKEPRYAVAYGHLLLEGIAADVYGTNALNMDWSSSITAKVTANCATAIADIQVYSMLVEPLK